MLIVPVVPVPVTVLPSGALVTVQFPDAGRPLNDTEPVDTRQVGCVMLEICGAEAAGAGLRTACVPGETQPELFRTVIV